MEFEIKECVLSESIKDTDREVFRVSREGHDDLLIARHSSQSYDTVMVHVQTYRRTWVELGYIYSSGDTLTVISTDECPLLETDEDISFEESLLSLLRDAVKREKLGSLLGS